MMVDDGGGRMLSKRIDHLHFVSNNYLEVSNTNSAQARNPSRTLFASSSVRVEEVEFVNGEVAVWHCGNS